MSDLISIESKIFQVRGKKVMLDRDLAMLYGAEVKQLTRQVRRNIERFPDDFMYQLTKQEITNLRCQIGASSWGGRRYLLLKPTLKKDRRIIGFQVDSDPKKD